MIITPTTFNELKAQFHITDQRLQRICRRPEIHVDIKQKRLTKEMVQKICVGLADIRKEDVDELEGSLTERFQKLYSPSFSHFLSSIGKKAADFEWMRVDKVNTSGKGFEGLQERVYVCMQHHFTLLNTPQEPAKAKIRNAEMLTSRLADREMPRGMVVHLLEGYFYVDRTFCAGGAHVSVLRDFAGQMPPKIICRGTAMRRSATGGFQSGLNDLLLEIGTGGVKAIWPQLSEYLKKEKIHSVELLGKSLGGAQVQLLAILIEGLLPIKIEQLTTVCSVGVGDKINTLFKRKVLDKRKTPFKMQLIRTSNDLIPTMGGVHLGAGLPGCDVDLYYIHPKKPTPALPSNLFTCFFRFLRSFSTAHCRQSTLDRFQWVKIEAKEQKESLLRLGTKLEKVRLCLAYTLHCLTLTLLNGPSFTAFYKKET